MRTPPFLSYDLEKQIHRSAKDEWQPHQTQSDRSFEWWYFTALVHDMARTPFILFLYIFSYPGKCHICAIPPLDATTTPEQAVYSCPIMLRNYTTAIPTR